MEYYRGNIPIIEDDGEGRDLLFPKGASFGAVPRDFSVQPLEMAQSPGEMVLINESEYDARREEEEATKSSLEHLYLRGGDSPAFTFLEQDGLPDCWAFSTGNGIMIDRLKQGLPEIQLNPHGVATMLNQTNGGWCGLSGKFGREVGYPVAGNGTGQWPARSRSRTNDTPALRENAALHQIKEDWVDLTQQVYDQNLSDKQLATCLFNLNPCPIDIAAWGHSILAIRWVKIESGRWLPLILNSWLGWGRHGLAVLSESMHRTRMGAISIRATVSSPK